jgi:short-subunit dehydrogenase
MTRRDSNRFRERYGPWALVTDAHASIAAEFARQLAAHGIHLILTGEGSPIEELGTRLRDAHKVLVGTARLDTADALICRVGSPLPQLPTENDLHSESAIVQLNLRVPALLAKHYGELMAARGRGGILFLASSPAMPGDGGHAEYNTSLAEAFWYELAPHGVDVMAVTEPCRESPPQGRQAESDLVSLVARALEDLERAGSSVPGRMGTLMGHLGSWIFSREPSERLAGVLHGRVARSALN